MKKGMTVIAGCVILLSGCDSSDKQMFCGNAPRTQTAIAKRNAEVVAKGIAEGLARKWPG